MRAELLPGTKNVVRFPVERRAHPTLDLMYEVAPDVREVFALADAFSLELPPSDLGDRADADAAEHIALDVPIGGPRREAMVDAMIDSVVAMAIAACRQAYDVAADAREAQDAILSARSAGAFWIDPLRERAEALGRRMAELLVIARGRVEEAAGVARAVGFARRDKDWVARDTQSEMEALLRLAV